jgi:predicted glycosyltransferase
LRARYPLGGIKDLSVISGITYIIVRPSPEHSDYLERKKSSSYEEVNNRLIMKNFYF